jgi:hypothetical protein
LQSSLLPLILTWSTKWWFALNQAKIKVCDAVFKIFLWPMPLFLNRHINTQTTHITYICTSITHNIINMLFLKPWRESNPGLIFLKRMRLTAVS